MSDTETITVKKEEKDLLESFKDKINEFSRAFAALVSIREKVANYPELLAEYNTLLREGEAIRATIDNVTTAIDAAIGWAKSTFNLDGVGQLGAIPLLPIAVIAGATATITVYVSDVVKFLKKFSEIERLVGQGLTVKEAANLVQQVETGNKPLTLTGRIKSVFMDKDKAFLTLALIGAGSVIWINRHKLIA